MTDAPREEPRLRVAVIGGGRMGAGIAQVFLTAGAEVTVQEPEAAAAYARIAKGLAIAESKSTPTTQPPTGQPLTTPPSPESADPGAVNPRSVSSGSVGSGSVRPGSVSSGSVGSGSVSSRSVSPRSVSPGSDRPGSASPGSGNPGSVSSGVVSSGVVSSGVVNPGSGNPGSVSSGVVSRGSVGAGGGGVSAEEALSRLVMGTVPHGVDLVVEAVPEDPKLKVEVLAEAEARAGERAVLASNTSSLSIGELAAGLERPERLIGLHFFNPVPVQKLVEIVVTAGTPDDVLGRAQGWVELIGKTGVVVNDSPGFASSRLGVLLGLEAMRMVEEGVASPEDIDTAMELGYRHPMGPIKLGDLVGLDVRLAIAEYLHQKLGERFEPPRILREKVAAGELGRKSGKGFYTWEEDR